MPAEYTYFRAEGRSLQALEARDEAQAELDTLKKKLAKKFGADVCEGWLDPGTDQGTARYRIRYFAFEPPAAPPAGWLRTDGQPLPSPTPEMPYSALPAPGSADHFTVAAMAGLMEREARRIETGSALGAPAMPLREVPSGSKSSSLFVRPCLVAGKEDASAQPSGRIREKGFVNIVIEGGRCRKPDPIKAQEFDGAWYIRVPNHKGTEEACFSPPGARRLSYAEMLEADAAEYKRVSAIIANFIPNGF
jgi:hypothetical protein